MKQGQRPLTLVDYQRIFQVAHGIIVELGKNKAKSCVFFSMVGAFILKKYHGIQARPVAGSAYFKLDESDVVLAVADPTKNFESSSLDGGFHCWVETDRWCIDFTAPLFPEMMQDAGSTSKCDRKMFQKSVASMAESPYALERAGDYFLDVDVELTRELMRLNVERNDVLDLINVASTWYRKAPMAMAREMSIMNDLGQVSKLSLDAPAIVGVW
ncbi:DUF2026 family protein [Paraburkholderia sp. BCC1876]|uniref:DUF2026 family protein n=1 Tax=Paraburkholderia sp. BCC1876 TaxID=2676303 RepID=UPI00158FC592|nr:DUF2026 family protein [Paraburkholderia sp. BCC1876]